MPAIIPFTQPLVIRNGEQLVITFRVKAPCDAQITSYGIQARVDPAADEPIVLGAKTREMPAGVRR
jgi:hypothetical protein